MAKRRASTNAYTYILTSFDSLVNIDRLRCREWEVSLTWAIAYTKQPGGKRKQITDFLSWATHDGQQYGEALEYAPLPRPLIDRVDAKIRLIVDGN